MLKKIIIYTTLCLAVTTFIYPFIWMISASLTAEKEIGLVTFFPRAITLSNYTAIFEKISLSKAFFNSLSVAVFTTGLVLIFAAIIGYALAKMEFKGKKLIFFTIIFTMTLPFQITLIPNYITMVKFGWIDTYMALIIPFAINSFAILMFRQAFQGLPQALIDAARMDGCNEMRIIFQILCPNIKPTIVTIIILTFMGLWNETLWPLIVIRDEAVMTMPQMVTLFSVGGRADAQLGVKIAAAVLLALPIMIVYVLFQKHFIKSMAASGMKD